VTIVEGRYCKEHGEWKSGDYCKGLVYKKPGVELGSHVFCDFCRHGNMWEHQGRVLHC
jgi:hypothetical protein